MPGAGVFDVILAAGVFGAAVFALFGRPRIHAAAMFLVFGVLLAVAWAWLEAPDVAIAEAVLGAGVTGVLIMNAVTAAPHPPPRQDGTSPHGPGTRRRWYGLFSGALAAAVGLGLLATVWQWQVATGVGEAARRQVGAAGVDHPVTAVLLNFRSYDTLLEIAVLAAAALGAMALRPSGRLFSGAPAPDEGPLPALVRVVVPVLVLLLGWLLVAGSTRPGGAFQAGALLTGALLMVYLAGIGTGRITARDPGPRWVEVVLLAGLAAFLVLAGATAAAGQGWLVLDPAWAGAVVLALEAVLMVSIGSTLAALLVVMDRINTEVTGRSQALGHPGGGDAH